MVKTNDGDVQFHLAKGYYLTRVLGKEFMMILRDKYAEPLVVLEIYQDKISSVRPYRAAEADKNYLSVLQKFVKEYQYSLTQEAAAALSLSVVIRDGKEEYFSPSEMTTKRLNTFFQNYDTLSISFNHIQKRRLVIPQTLKPCRLNFSRILTDKIIISPNSKAELDFSDNLWTDTLIIGESFNGRLTFSRSNLLNIKLGDNCRCDIACVRSGKCFDLSVGDVYSGSLELHDSCFHRLTTGYYCYAVMQLTENWGKKEVYIGKSFRGSLTIDASQIQHLDIDSDCRGRIAVRERHKREKIFNCPNPIILDNEELPATPFYGPLLKKAKHFWYRHFL